MCFHSFHWHPTLFSLFHKTSTTNFILEALKKVQFAKGINILSWFTRFILQTLTKNVIRFFGTKPLSWKFYSRKNERFQSMFVNYFVVKRIDFSCYNKFFCVRKVINRQGTKIIFPNFVIRNSSRWLYFTCLHYMSVTHFRFFESTLSKHLCFFTNKFFLHVFRLFNCMLQFVCFCLSQANTEETNSYQKSYVPIIDCGSIVPSFVTFPYNAFRMLGVRLCFM